MSCPTDVSDQQATAVVIAVALVVVRIELVRISKIVISSIDIVNAVRLSLPLGTPQDRVVRPILDNTAAPSLEEVCARHGVQDKKKASNMIVTVKRCFQATLAECVRNTVAGAFTAYDLPDLAASCAPRRLFIIDPVDHLGEPASPSLFEEEYEFPLRVYRAQHASDDIARAKSLDEALARF